MRALMISAALLAAIAPALAQQAAPDAAQLASTITCVSPAEAQTALDAAITRLLQTAPRDTAITVLNQISADQTVCAPVRDAATGLAATVVAASAAAADQQISEASGSIVGATLAEAEHRAANLKFEVGPPPRNMTKGREAS